MRWAGLGAILSGKGSGPASVFYASAPRPPAWSAVAAEAGVTRGGWWKGGAAGIPVRSAPTAPEAPAAGDSLSAEAEADYDARPGLGGHHGACHGTLSSGGGHGWAVAPLPARTPGLHDAGTENG